MSSSFSNAQISSRDQYGNSVLLKENDLVKKGEFKFEAGRLNQKQLETFNAFSIPSSEVEVYGNRPGIVLPPPMFSVKDGIVYEGHFDSVRKIQHGVGVQQWSDGAYYRGVWFQGIRHGRGLYVSPKGDMEVGTWENDVLTAYGRKIWKNSDDYTGWFSNGKEDRMGKMKWGNGDEYTGAFSQGQITGRGRLEKDRGETMYEGDFLDGLFHGKGTLVNQEGVYKGNWDSGKRHGYGEFTPKNPRADNPIYKGHWNNDKKHGDARISYPGQQSIETKWQLNDRIS